MGGSSPRAGRSSRRSRSRHELIFCLHGAHLRSREGIALPTKQARSRHRDGYLLLKVHQVAAVFSCALVPRKGSVRLFSLCGCVCTPLIRRALTTLVQHLFVAYWPWIPLGFP